MAVSRQRRRETIDALRAGTVPRRGLDLLAVGMDRFEAAIDGELEAARAGSGILKAVRGEYGSGKTFFARWLQERAKRADNARKAYFLRLSAKSAKARRNRSEANGLRRLAAQALAAADDIESSVTPRPGREGRHPSSGESTPRALTAPINDALSTAPTLTLEQRIRLSALLAAKSVTP